MQFVTLDIITRRILIERGLSIHFYLEILFHCATAIRELNKDSLKIINAANLPINDYYAIDLPSDFMDDLAVCIPSGGELQRLPKNDTISPLRVYSPTTNQFVPQTTTETDENGETVFGFDGAAFWFWNISDYAEPTGRFFGSGGGTSSGYKVVKERRQIQLTDAMGSSNVVLLYISNGQSADNATRVDWLAFRAIQTWAQWQMGENRDNEQSPEARTWWNARRHYRANVDDLTKVDILNIIRRSFTATIKN